MALEAQLPQMPLFEGTSQPLSLGALTRDVPMANTPTLASFVELASQNCFLFSSPTKSPLQPSLQKPNLTPATKLRFGSLGQSTASTANDPHLDSDLTGDASNLTSPWADRFGESPAILARPIPYITQFAIDRQAEVEDKSVFTYHSFRVLLATQLGVSGRSGPEIQALCRWQSPASLAIYVRMQPREAIAMLDGAQNAKITSYSTVNLSCFKTAHLSDEISLQCGTDGDKDRNGTFA